MQCPSCGTQLLEGKRFCHVCGAAAASSCPSCGAALRPDFRFCPDCGGALGEETPGTGSGAAPPAETDPPPASAGTASSRPAPAGPIAGERKQVTVLFCDLEGSTAIAEKLDPEEYRELLDRYLELALRQVDRMGGMVNQLAGDGLMALFGAPVAHEDAPERAVRAALGIQSALALFNRERTEQRLVELRARIGIHTGPVVVGTVGNDLKMDYTAVGDTTNLAARLQARAEPGSTLISEVTQRLIAGRFDLRETGPVSFKGKSEPVVAYEVLGLAEAATPMAIAEARGLTPLVGLDEELAQLEACYERLSGSLPQLVSVVGDPGSGKSRLVHEFKRRVAERDAVILEARCSSLSQSVPFAPFVAMLKSFFGLAPGESPDCACDKIAAKLRDWKSDMAIYPAMCQLLTVAEGSEQLPTEGLRERAFEAAGTVFGGLATRGPLLLILEDLHWIDEASREFLEIAVSRVSRAPVMILVTHRGEYQPNWRVTAALTQLWLRPLDDDQATRIVRERAGGPLPAELERRIVRRAEGNPFFLEETTRALLEEGQLLRHESGVQLSRPVKEIRIPDTVQELIGARLDRLGPAAKRAAQVAAVFGRQFRADHLSALLQPEGIDARSALAELEQRGVIHDPGSGEEHRFGESLTQSVAYEGLLLRERRELHEKIATLLEGDPRGMSAERAGLIAHHLARSENRRKAIDSLLVAARNAQEMPSYPSAVRLFRQAWELAESELAEAPSVEAQRRVLDATLGLCGVIVLYGALEHHEEERAALRGRELAEALGDRPALARALALHGMIVVGRDGERFTEGIALMERSLEIARAEGGLVAISSQRAVGWTYLLDGRFAKAMDALEQVLRELETLGEADPPSDLYLSVEFFRANVLLQSGDLAGAEALALSLHERCVAASNRTLESASASVLAQVHFYRGDYSTAQEWAERALETGQAIGSAGAIRSGVFIAAGARLELGEPIPRARFLEAIDQILSSGASDFTSNSHLVVDLLLQLGETERAASYAEEAAARSGGRLREMLSLVANGHVLRERGSSHWADAERAYARALELAREVGSAAIEASASIGLGALDLARGESSRGEARLREAAAAAEAAGFGHYRDRALRALAEWERGAAPLS